MSDYKPSDDESIIYMAKSTLETTEIYIGKTERTLSERRKQHESSARKGDGTRFHEVLINKGFANWEWKILEICKRGNQFEVEKSYIEKLRAVSVDLLNTSHNKKDPKTSPTFVQPIKRTSKPNATSDLFRREAGILKPVINLVTGKKYRTSTEACEMENEKKDRIRKSCNTGVMLQNGSRFAWLDLEDNPVLTAGHASEKVIGESARRVKNLVTGKVFKNTDECAFEHGVSHNAISSNASGGSYRVKEKWVFCYLDDNGQELLKPKHTIGLKKLKDKDRVKYLAWHINDQNRENLYEFKNLQSLVDDLNLNGKAHVKSVCDGERTHVEHWRVAFADDDGKPVLKQKHHESAKKVIRQVICLDDEKIFNSQSEAGSHYRVISSQIGLCASGKAKSVNCNGKRLRFAYLDGEGKPILTERHRETLDHRGKHRLMHIESGEIFNSLNAFCRKTGVPWKRAKKHLDGEKVDLLGHEFIVLD